LENRGGGGGAGGGSGCWRRREGMAVDGAGGDAGRLAQRGVACVEVIGVAGISDYVQHPSSFLFCPVYSTSSFNHLTIEN